MDDEMLLELLGATLDPGERQPPPVRLAQLRARVAAAAPTGGTNGGPGPGGRGGPDGSDSAASPPPGSPVGARADRHQPRPGRRWALLAAAAVAAVVFAVGALVGRLAAGDGDSDGGPGGEVAQGVVEFDGPLTAADGEVGAQLLVRLAGTGRVVTFESETLPILPKGEFYELWFVGPGDTLAQPNRISAGTFHPDEEGRSFVQFSGAFDPALYPGVSVTLEPGDGDPARTGPEVLRA